jgi:hypothetical protein
MKLFTHTSVEGRRVLAFRTGCTERDFARLKAFTLLESEGLIVRPEGAGPRVAVWKPEGSCLAEDGTMLIYGPPFEGEDFASVAAAPGSAERIPRLARLWALARLAAAGSAYREGRWGHPFPAGALLAADGAFLFPPEGLARLCLEGAGAEARAAFFERLVPPDREGGAAELFCAAALLYQGLCGAPAFPGDDVDAARLNMTRGVFIPAGLAAPGLKRELASLIDGAFAPELKAARLGGSPAPKKRQGAKAGISEGGRFLGAGRGGADGDGPITEQRNGNRPPPSFDSDDTAGLAHLADVLAGGPAKADWFEALGPEALDAARRGREKLARAQAARARRRRFFAKRGGALAVGLGVAAFALLVTLSVLRSRASLPTTEGLTPAEVLAVWYGAYERLDHTLMESCARNGAGKDDITMVINFYVVSKMREAYESPGAQALLPAADWLAAGAPETGRFVVGVTGLEITPLEAGEERARFAADYVLWIPGQREALPETEERLLTELPPPPEALERHETLTLERRKGLWHITRIERK